MAQENLKTFLTAAAATFVGVAIYFAARPHLHRSFPQAFEGRGGGAGA